ncbi:MAG: dihydrodipicolinate synthase family protein, partial [Anaeroplasmataceae bacterium]|nr:dihydrodipicolinate synthase family protein [Anaeroplasmataceae bacterium]
VTKPVILYNVPKRTGMEIPLDVIKALSYHPNIIGIKDASGNALFQQQIATFTNENFSLYGGDDALTLLSYHLGAKGIISVVSNAFPKEMKLIYESMDKDPKISKTLFFKLLDLINVMYQEVSPIGIKYILYILGFKTLNYRRPLDEPSLKLKMLLKTELQKLIEE